MTVVFSGTPVYSLNKTDRRDIAEILLKVELNTITLTPSMGNQETHCPLFISTNISLNARQNRMGNQETHCPLFISTNISLNASQNRFGFL
jgi:hypothetical protein